MKLPFAKTAIQRFGWLIFAPSAALTGAAIILERAGHTYWSVFDGWDLALDQIVSSYSFEWWQTAGQLASNFVLPGLALVLVGSIAQRALSDVLSWIRRGA